MVSGEHEEEERLENVILTFVHERWSDYTPPEAIGTLLERKLIGEMELIRKRYISLYDEVNESEITLTLNKIADSNVLKNLHLFKVVTLESLFNI